MSNIIVFNTILTVDPIGDKILILSLEKNKIVFPTTKIENPKFLYNEIRYNIKNMFVKNMIKFLEEIRISFIDIQNYILLELLDDPSYKKLYGANDDDIIILCGIVLYEKLMCDKTYWLSIKNFITESKPDGDLQKDVIKYVFDHLII